MNTHQNIDFNNPSKELLFRFCMQIVSGWQLTENVDYDIDRESFRDLLVENGLKEFTDLLLDYQIKWLDIAHVFYQRRTKFDDNEKKDLPYKLKVARILKMFLSSEEKSFEGIEISVSDPTNKETIVDSGLFLNLKEPFLKEFERLGLNETKYTKEEAIEEINSSEDIDDEWLFNNGFDFDEIQADPEVINDYYIEKYRKEHYKPREISLDVVNSSIKELEEWLDDIKKGVGARIKNLEIGGLAKELSFLHSISKFLNQDEYSSIKDFPLRNETCKFIYEYFEFWDLLEGFYTENKSDKIRDKERREKFIRSLIKNYEKSSKSENIHPMRDVVMVDVDREMEVDLFKKVKDGMISPQKFYERYPLYTI